MSDSWRPVVGYEGLYEVSSGGMVRSLARTVKRGDHCVKVRERILRPAVSPLGYSAVGLANGGIAKTCGVHRIVAEAFVPNPHGKPEVNHLDGNPRNNTPSNLEWCTRSENMRHSYEFLDRDRVPGERKGNAVLTEAAVKAIREEKEAGKSNLELAEQYGVDPSNISLIYHRKIWRHI